MEKPYILHMMTTEKNLSPFDANMAIDAGWVSIVPYLHVETAEVQGLVQDAIFSRGPKGVKRTALFIGGRDTEQAMAMLSIARESMVPPFEISAFADPSGAFTTAAGMVAAVEHELINKHKSSLNAANILVFGGTGPVGQAAAVLSAKAGANVTIIGRQLEKSQRIAKMVNEMFGDSKTNIQGAADASKPELMQTADVVYATAAAGIQVLDAEQIANAPALKVAADVNAVPPSGIAGLDAMHHGTPIPGSNSGATGIGALIGNVKYHAQSDLLKRMVNSGQPVYLHFEHAFEVARAFVSKQ